MSRTSDYWRDREREWLEQYLKDEAKYAKDVQSIYDYMLDEIEKEINDNFEKYASKEGISMADAKKRADKIDIEAYMRKAEKYVKEKDFSEQANKEMRLYNMTMRVNRLELLKAKIGLELTAGHDELVTYTGEKLTERVKDTLRKNAAILGPTVMDVADHKADVIVNSSFHNATFSDRIWQHQDVLRNELTNILSNALIAGRNPREFIPDIRKRFDVSRYQAERLLRTELARVQTEAQKASYEAEGIDEYEYIACGLGDVCDVCRALDGKHFKVSKMVVGENAPPMHPNCHCSTGPYMDRKEYDEWLDSYKDHGLDFEEWKNQNNGKTSQIVKSNNANIKSTLSKDNIQNLATAFEKKDDFNDFIKILNDNPNDDIRKLYKKYINDCKSITYESRRGFYDPNDDSIHFNYPLKEYIDAGVNKYSTLAHECGHMFDAHIGISDRLNYNEVEKINTVFNKKLKDTGYNIKDILSPLPSSSDEFLSAIREDKDSLWEMIKSDAWEDAKKEMNNHDASNGVQDIFDGMFGTKDSSALRWGHGERYYGRKYARIKDLGLHKELKKVYKELGYDANNQGKCARLCRDYETASEAWANIASAETTQSEALEYVKKYLPNSYEAFKSIIKKAG